MKTNKIFLFTVLLIISFSSLSLRQIDENKPSPKAKYIFLFIGDGMGLNQVMITNEYLKLHKQPEISFLSFKNLALTITSCADSNKITDSAAGGTAIACSRKTNNGALGMSRTSGEKFESIAEFLKQKGLKVGILSSVGLNHATPASFYANQPSRSLYAEIAMEMPGTNFDFFGGGGIISKNQAEFDEHIDRMKKSNYSIIAEKTIFNPQVVYGDKVYYSLFNEQDDAAIPYRIDQNGSQTTLGEFVDFGIQFLDNPKGFFMMAEGGKIDWAAHDNDGATVIHEVIDFDFAIQKALEFYKKHPNETLIIVTADHETGGMSFGSNQMSYSTDFLKIDQQKISEGNFPSLLDSADVKKNTKLIAENFSILVNENYVMKYNAKTLTNQMVDSLNHSAGISWTTHAHTGVPIVTYALGVGSQQFNGIIDNTDIAKFIKKATGLEVKGKR